MLIANPAEGYYQHKTSGEKMTVMKFNFKCPYDEMDQWQRHRPDGKVVTPEDEVAEREAVIIFFAAMNGRIDLIIDKVE